MPSRVWLNHIINAVVRRQHSNGQSLWPTELSSVETEYECGIISPCLTADDFAMTQAEPSLASTMNHFALCIRASQEQLGTSRDHSQNAILLLSISAYATGFFDDAVSLIALCDESDVQERIDKSNEIGARIGRALLKGVPPNANTLGDHPFLHLRRHGEFILFKRLGITVRSGLSNLGNIPENQAVYADLGWSQTRLHRAISASIALAHVDGIIDGEERDLIDSLIEAARFDETERAMLVNEFDRPLTIDELASPPMDDVERQFLFRLLFLGVHINGRYHPNEKGFLEALADEVGVDVGHLDDHEDVALVTFESNYGLLNRPAPSGLLTKVRERLFERAEDILKRNGKRIIAEVNETRELVELIAESTRRTLTPDEETKIREQVSDFARAIPALAIFAAPGGAILLPLISKYLRINFIPSNFVDKADLGGSDIDGLCDESVKPRGRPKTVRDPEHD